MKRPRPKHLGMLVIGQSPRADVEAQMRALVGADVAITLRGALDGMTRAEIAAIPPIDGDDTLFTKLPSGEGVTISKHVVEARAKVALAAMRDEGFTVTMLCCTGEFPALDGAGLVVLPSAVLSGVVAGLLPRGKLGLLLPLAEQTEQLAAKWRRPGLEVAAVPLLPIADDATVDAAAHRLAALNPDLVVMDCISYTQAMKDRVRAICPVPAILSLTAVARVVREMLD